MQGVAEAECRRAAAAAEEVYIREFNQEGTPAEADALLQEHLVSSNIHCVNDLNDHDIFVHNLANTGTGMQTTL